MQKQIFLLATAFIMMALSANGQAPKQDSYKRCFIGSTFFMLGNLSANNKPDDLVQIDAVTGVAEKVGSIGYSGVYALTAAWEQLYGLTGSGDLIAINAQTGRGTLIHRFPGKMWFGAASTPQR